MPTPFYHLSIAEELLRQPGLDPDLFAWLQSNRFAFLLGNTAPDVQTVSGQARQATHFFDVPQDLAAPAAWDVLFSTYPSLACPVDLPPDQAAFIAGYVCHLIADVLWVQQIFLPAFGPQAVWATPGHRLYIHNVLRAYLDAKRLPRLAPDLHVGLAAVQPKQWLPFVTDTDLLTWGAFLAQQLAPGAAIQTVDVFAARQGIPPQDFYKLLESQERMEAEVFAFLPRGGLEACEKRLLDQSLRYLTHYFSAKPCAPTQRFVRPAERPGATETLGSALNPYA